MKITREQKKVEALERMKLLKLNKNIIKEFEKENVVNMSENGGYLYWLDSDQQAIVDDFETKHDALAYHVIHDYTQFGELYALLYVSKYKKEWQDEKRELKCGYALAYVKNVTDDWCSEFGSIGIKPQLGGLVRTC